MSAEEAGENKRITLVDLGKVKRKHSHKNHILTKKRPDRIRRLRGMTVASKPDEVRIHKLLPYGGK